MTLWLGYCPPTANSGLDLRDNGICLLNESGVVLAVSEERLSREKHDNRLDYALPLALDYANSTGENIAGAAFSTCSDSPWTAKTLPTLDVLQSRPVPSHHYSHALSAFLGSTYSASLIFVADAGGNTLFPSDTTTWWSVPREQTSLWIGMNGNVHLLDRPHFEPFDIGYGEWYRAITYFLGWHSHTLSGNTMALSAYGDARRIFDFGIWDEDLTGTLGGRIQNDPRHPIDMTLLLLKAIGSPSLRPRRHGEPITEQHSNLAAYLQQSLETSLASVIEEALRKYGLTRLCLSGGVAQNCVIGAKLGSVLGCNNVFISAYSGDTGQCVGNAMYARLRDLGANSHDHGEELFVGPPYESREIDAALADLNLSVSSRNDADIATEVAERLVAGQIVGVYRGRSEFGPRALGHRSVLCDPHNVQTVHTVKRAVKQRDDFMPLAPVIDQALRRELGDIPASTTMTFAPHIPEPYRQEFGEAIHIDNTARIQVCEPNSLLHYILSSFTQRTGRRVIINTSFNRRGEPIVETPRDALHALRELAIDCLILEDRLVTRGMLEPAAPSHKTGTGLSE